MIQSGSQPQITPVQESPETDTQVSEDPSIQVQLECLRGEIEDAVTMAQDLHEELASLEDAIEPVLSGEAENVGIEDAHLTPEPITKVGEEIYAGRTELSRQKRRLEKLGEYLRQLQERVEL